MPEIAPTLNWEAMTWEAMTGIEAGLSTWEPVAVRFQEDLRVQASP